jgi:cytosine/adenosine deaminase-related metal-dependent hydrolase
LSYLKFSADQIFTGTELRSDQSVLITDDKGVIIDIVAIENAGDDVKHYQGIISPGFVNAHCHLELSHMKGLIPEHTGLPNFILKIVNERHFPDDEILVAIAKAEDEMIANGIVAVGDICNNTLSIEQKKINRLSYYNFIEVSGWKPAIAHPRYQRSIDIFNEYQTQTPNSTTSLTPHAPYSVSNELWEMLLPHFYGNTVTIHNQETKAEDELFKTGTGEFIGMYESMNIDQTHFTPTGKSSLQSYFQKLTSAKNKLLVHNTNITENDITFASANSSEIFFCLCPNANLYIENSLPPINLLRKHQSNIIIGTDSLASNHSLSILDELKTIAKNFQSIPLEELLQWSTLNGAKALQMDNTIGSFEKGKKPGVILLQGSSSTTINSDTIVRRLI